MIAPSADSAAHHDAKISDLPRFDDGDVLILLSNDHVYQLHSSTLIQNSEYFRHIITDGTSTQLGTRARRGRHVIRWRFHFALPHDTNDNESMSAFTMIVRLFFSTTPQLPTDTLVR